MIDLTPLDVRKKKSDFRRGLRGYDALQVDDFLDIVADRLDNLVRENLALRERVARFESQFADYREREKALTEALVTAQEMREEVRAQSAREADAARREAEKEAVRIRAEAQRVREREEEALRRLRSRQLEFIQTYRAFLERELAELASTVGGIELNGGIGDALTAPPPLAEPTIPSSPAGAPVAITEQWLERPAPTPGVAAPTAAEEQWAGSPAAMASPNSQPRTAKPAEVGEGVGSGGVGSPPEGRHPQPVEEPLASDAAEPELILTVDDVLTDDEFAEVGDTGDEGEDRSAPDVTPAAGAESGVPETESSTSRRRGAGDDTQDLLRSLFGDEH